jgi:hypothetical protein
MIFQRNGLKELEIFRLFIVDKNLPKYKSKDKTSVYISKDSESYASPSNFTIISESDDNISDPYIKPISSSYFYFINKLLNFIFNRPKKPKYPADKFFSLIFNSKEEIVKFNEKNSKLVNELKNAVEMGQKALSEKIKDNLEIKMLENKLLVNDKFKYVSEEIIIKFALESEKGIKLDWVKNYSRPIPEEVRVMKKKVDEYNVFDNYAIMHYDPEGKATELTKEEIEKKRDPILFGVIKNSKKLYFITDWKDDLCDLTLNKIIDKYGQESVNDVEGA